MPEPIAAGDLHGDRRLRQALRHLPRPLRQHGQFPRLSAHSRQRLRRQRADARQRPQRRQRHRWTASNACIRVTTGADARRDRRRGAGWIGTPYRHQASLKGVGCDCLGLVRGVWRAVCGDEPEAVPAYSPDWAEASRRETLGAGGRPSSGRDRAAASSAGRRAAVPLARTVSSPSIAAIADRARRDGARA